MTFFYLKHHFLSIVRSKSFMGEVFALLFLGVMAERFASFLFLELDTYVQDLALFLEINEGSHESFLLSYVMVDLVARVILKRPDPKSHYYLFLTKNTKSIAWQYLITSLFGIIPFMLLIPQLTVAMKSTMWLGEATIWVVMALFVSNHYVGLALQFLGKRTKGILLAGIMSVMALAFGKVIPVDWLAGVVISPFFSFVVFIIAVVLAFVSVDSKLKRRELYSGKKAFSFFDILPTISFKNPLFQLEWALIVRNKRTRSNLLMGMISIMILPFLMDDDSPQLLILLLTLFCTSYFIIQHGVYSLGWEGSYFDFLTTNVSLTKFIESRYVFYVGTCVIGLVLFLIPTLIVGQDVVLLVCMFLYNVGITIPLVIYRSAFNSQKIELGENSFMNYNGMMTGPIMVTSLLVTMLPFVVFGIGQGIFGENAAYALALVGVAGIVARPLLLKKIVQFISRKKYHLSQSFKS